MEEFARKALNAFPEWLRSLGDDLVALSDLLKDTELSEDVRLWVASSVSYVFKSVDLIPDGIEDLGYLDDAFVMRVVASRGVEQLEQAGASSPPVLSKLAEDATLIKEFLGSEYARLDEFVSGLRIAVVRGKSPSDIVQDPTLAAQVRDEVGVFARSYQMPEFTQEERTLIKLKSFLSTKLP